MNPTTKNLIFCIMGDDWKTLASIPLYPQKVVTTWSSFREGKQALAKARTTPGVLSFRVCQVFDQAGCSVLS
jgi:hypothetical protein